MPVSLDQPPQFGILLPVMDAKADSQQVHQMLFTQATNDNVATNDEIAGKFHERGEYLFSAPI